MHFTILISSIVIIIIIIIEVEWVGKNIKRIN